MKAPSEGGTFESFHEGTNVVGEWLSGLDCQVLGKCGC